MSQQELSPCEPGGSFAIVKDRGTLQSNWLFPNDRSLKLVSHAITKEKEGKSLGSYLCLFA